MGTIDFQIQFKHCEAQKKGYSNFFDTQYQEQISRKNNRSRVKVKDFKLNFLKTYS